MLEMTFETNISLPGEEITERHWQMTPITPLARKHAHYITEPRVDLPYFLVTIYNPVLFFISPNYFELSTE